MSTRIKLRAAILVLVMAIGIYFLFFYKPKPPAGQSAGGNQVDTLMKQNNP